MRMLQKKKEDRPIITDVIDYFNERRVPCAISTVLSPLDRTNYQQYKELKASAFEKKRRIETNKMGITKDFSALKDRINEGNKQFKLFMFKQQTESETDPFLQIIQNQAPSAQNPTRTTKLASSSDITSTPVQHRNMKQMSTQGYNSTMGLSSEKIEKVPVFQHLNFVSSVQSSKRPSISSMTNTEAKTEQ